MRDIEETIAFKDVFGSKYLKFKEEISYTPETKDYVEEVIQYILDNHTILSKNKLDKMMNALSKKYNLPKKPRRSIINLITRQKIDQDLIDEETYHILNRFLVTKANRSLSGILELAIMTSGKEFSCAYDCHYCPNQPGMPRSYVALGPSAQRALRLSFDTMAQFYERASTYALNGHPVDKIEIIVLGGTWDSYSIEYQREFVKLVYRAANTFYDQENNLDSRNYTMEEEIKINESALCKIIGFTIETRPDQISKEQIIRLLTYGVTRVQIGIQHTNNQILKKINRQCTIEQVYEAIYLLKEAGLKVQSHWMPNLPGSSPELDKEMFDQINYNPLLQTDDIKIYPTIVTTTSQKDTAVKKPVYTKIEQWYQDGTYIPYDNSLLDEVIIYGKSHMPPWVRISRVFRDIPMDNIIGGADVPNLREVLHKKMAERGLRCQCIRCSEVKGRIIPRENIKLEVLNYQASYSKEYFINMVSKDENGHRVLHGFVRLRLPDFKNKDDWIPELSNTALIREVHVYGKLKPSFKINSDFKSNTEYQQHRGLGRLMILEAEKIASQNGYNRISITSGIGVRNYYKQLGYSLENYYMIKKIKIPITYFIKENTLSIAIIFVYLIYLYYRQIHLRLYQKYLT